MNEEVEKSVVTTVFQGHRQRVKLEMDTGCAVVYITGYVARDLFQHHNHLCLVVVQEDVLFCFFNRKTQNLSNFLPLLPPSPLFLVQAV